MLGALDHVGYLTDDLDGVVAEMRDVFGLAVARELELPQFSVLAVFLGEGSGNVEVFTLTDPELLGDRLQGERVVLDHAAHEVADIAATCAHMAAHGVIFTGPDRRARVDEPFQLGGALHIWTVPESSCGQSLQLLQR